MSARAIEPVPAKGMQRLWEWEGKPIFESRRPRNPVYLQADGAAVFICFLMMKKINGMWNIKIGSFLAVYFNVYLFSLQKQIFLLLIIF